MTQLFDTILTQPFAQVLKFILGFVGSYGLALIIFTVLTKLIMVPFQIKSKKATFDQRRLSPQIKAIEKKYKDDKVKYNEEMQKLYEQEGFNPMGGCLPTLITLPIIMGLYGVITKPLSNLMKLDAGRIAEVASRLGVEAASNGTYNEIALAEMLHGNLPRLVDISPDLFEINFGFLGFNLAETPLINNFSLLWLLPILSALTGYIYMTINQKYMPPMEGSMASTNKMMNLTMPIMSLIIGFSLPAGVTLYWITGNLFMMAQEPLLQWYLSKSYYAEIEARDASKKSKKKKKKPAAEEGSEIE